MGGCSRSRPRRKARPHGGYPGPRRSGSEPAPKTRCEPSPRRCVSSEGPERSLERRARRVAFHPERLDSPSSSGGPQRNAGEESGPGVSRLSTPGGVGALPAHAPPKSRSPIQRTRIAPCMPSSKSVCRKTWLPTYLYGDLVRPINRAEAHTNFPSPLPRTDLPNGREVPWRRLRQRGRWGSDRQASSPK